MVQGETCAGTVKRALTVDRATHIVCIVRVLALYLNPAMPEGTHACGTNTRGLFSHTLFEGQKHWRWSARSVSAQDNVDSDWCGHSLMRKYVSPTESVSNIEHDCPNAPFERNLTAFSRSSRSSSTVYLMSSSSLYKTNTEYCAYSRRQQLEQ